MQPTPTLLAASSLVALLSPGAFAAEDVALSFDLGQPDWAAAETSPLLPSSASVPAAEPAAHAGHQPLPIPAHAANPPMRYHSPEQLPAGVYRRGVAVALTPSTTATALLPPAPPAPSPVAVAAAPPAPVAPVQKPVEAVTLALDFGLEPSPAVLTARAELARPQPPANPLPKLFEGDSDSLVAWAVGSAEGTRTPNGTINRAYFGHTDPGNRAWNMGTFSYQHGAKTPEEADRKQLARLQNQAEVLRERARQQGLNLTLEETLNGVDLANQSPLAAIGRVGYIERLVEAKQSGLEGAEAILVARTRSYINPNTGRWNAPGLGNTEASIRRDQKRRADMVAQAIEAYALQNPDFPAQAWVLEPAPVPTAVAAEPPKEPVDEIFTVWTDPSDPVVAQAETATAPVVPEAATAEEATAEATPGDRLAALWQLTVDRLNTSPSSADLPQAAALAGMFVPHPLAAAPSTEAEATTTEATAPEATAAEATAIASPPAAPAPAWATTREGSQSTAAPDTPAQGAVPESTVYEPSTDHPQTSSTAAPEPDPAIAAEITPASHLPTAPESLDTARTAAADPGAASAAAALATPPENSAAVPPTAGSEATRATEPEAAAAASPDQRQEVALPGTATETLSFAKAASEDRPAAADPGTPSASRAPTATPGVPTVGIPTEASPASQPAEPVPRSAP